MRFSKYRRVDDGGKGYAIVNSSPHSPRPPMAILPTPPFRLSRPPVDNIHTRYLPTKSPVCAKMRNLTRTDACRRHIRRTSPLTPGTRARLDGSMGPFTAGTRGSEPAHAARTSQQAVCYRYVGITSPLTPPNTSPQTCIISQGRVHEPIDTGSTSRQTI